MLIPLNYLANNPSGCVTIAFLLIEGIHGNTGQKKYQNKVQGSAIGAGEGINAKFGAQVRPGCIRDMSEVF